LTDDGILILEIGHEATHFEAAFPELEPLWLDTAATERQIMLLRADQLQP
jgi:ribosomal protein L3 glutamine methyltransferase